MAYHQINDNDIEPLVIVRALITVAGNIGGAHLGIRSTARLFRNLAAALEACGKQAMN